MENATVTSSAASQIFGADLGIKQEPVVVAPVVEPVVTTPVVEPIVTPPVVDTTVHKDIILEDEPAANATPVFDENKYLTDTFGTTDKTVIKDRFTKYEQVNKDLEEAALKLAQPKYNNKVAEVLDEILSKTGGDLNSNKEFVKNTLHLLTTDETQLDAISLVKFNLRSQFPKLTSEQMDAHIAHTYMQGDEYSDEMKLAGQVKLQQDAQNASIALKDLKAKALTNDTSKQVALQNLQEEKRKQSWIEPVQKVVEDFKTIKLNIGKVGDKNAFINFDIPQDVVKRYQEQVYNTMLNTGGLPNQENIALANHVLKAVYLVENFDHLTSHIASKLQSDSIRKEIKEYHNPNTTGNNAQRQEVVKQKSQSMVYAEAMGYKPNG